MPSHHDWTTPIGTRIWEEPASEREYPYHFKCGRCGETAVFPDEESRSYWVDEHLNADCYPQNEEDEADEEMVENEETGGRKGRKLARFDLIPAGPLTRVAEHYGRGARKYEERNWERGYDWSLSFGAMMRHAWAFWNGEDDDPETGSPHLAAVVFHALALMQFGKQHPELDDRPSAEVKRSFQGGCAGGQGESGLVRQDPETGS